MPIIAKIRVRNEPDVRLRTLCENKRDEAFEEYLWSRLKLIHVPNKDDAFLLMKMHEMYANPDRNKFAAQREIVDN